jgi:lipoprotein-anchoring transpeptidase ErfK/SrfK
VRNRPPITLLAALTLVPVIAMFVAVLTVPRSASALPVFEFTTAKGPLRVTSADLGVVRGHRGLEIDRLRFDAAIAKLQKVVRQPSTPSRYELKPDHKVLLKKGTVGFELDPVAMREMLLRALQGARSNLKLPTRAVKPAPAPSHAIVVNLRQFRLDLYKGPSHETHFTVGVGALSFPTPPGAYYVRSKAMNPTWRNPGSGWARGMPSYIPPGPRNPLGTRALRLDRGALVIHGTPQPWTIGTRSSHGCIRMKRPDVEKLFDMVPEQTPVFIVP